MISIAKRKLFALSLRGLGGGTVTTRPWSSYPRRWLVGIELEELMNFKMFGAMYFACMGIQSKFSLNKHHLKTAINATCRIYPMFRACVKEDGISPSKYYFDEALREPQLTVLDVDPNTEEGKAEVQKVYLKHLGDLSEGPLQNYILFPEVKEENGFKNVLALMNVPFISDGVGLLSHGRDVLQNLNKVCKSNRITEACQSYPVFPAVAEMTRHLFPADQNPALSYDIGVFGPVPQRAEARSQHRQFSAEELSKLLDVCRQNNATLTGLFTYLCATHLSEILPKRSPMEDKEILVEVPINLRNACLPQVPSSYGGNYTTTGQVTVPHPSFLPGDKALIWDGARRCTTRIRQEKHDMTLLRMTASMDENRARFWAEKPLFRKHLMVTSYHLPSTCNVEDPFLLTNWTCWTTDYGWYLLDVRLETFCDNLIVDFGSCVEAVPDFETVTKFAERITALVRRLIDSEVSRRH